MHLMVFSKGQGIEWGIYFLGCQNFKYCLGVLEIPDIFGGGWVDAGPEPMYEEKMRVPPGVSSWEFGTYPICLNSSINHIKTVTCD